METVTQTMRYRQALINYANKHGVTKAAIRYKTNRQYIYRWTKRYDGTLQSLADKSHRPHHHPNQHTEEEIKLIMDMRKRNGKPSSNTFLTFLWEAFYSVIPHNKRISASCESLLVAQGFALKDIQE